MREILVKRMAFQIDFFTGPPLGKWFSVCIIRDMKEGAFPCFLCLVSFCAFSWWNRSLLVFQHKRSPKQKSLERAGPPRAPLPARLMAQWAHPGALVSRENSLSLEMAKINLCFYWELQSSCCTVPEISPLVCWKHCLAVQSRALQQGRAGAEVPTSQTGEDVTPLKGALCWWMALVCPPPPS